MSVLPQDSSVVAAMYQPLGYQFKSNLGYQSNLHNTTLRWPLITGQLSKQLLLIGPLWFTVVNPIGPPWLTGDIPSAQSHFVI